MVEVDDPSIKGAMLTNCGRYAIPAIDAQAYAVGKKEKPPFMPQEQPEPKMEENTVPEELLCLICRDMLCDAVVIPCCGNSYCDECIRSALLDSQDHVCPTCNQTDVSPDSLFANKFLRQAVSSFDKDQGNTQSLKSATVVPTPPARTTESQPTSHHSSFKQQDNVPVHPKTINAPQASLLPMVLTTVASDTPCSSPQSMQSQQDTLNNDGKKECDSAASSQSKLVLSNDPTAPDSLSLLNSLVKPTEETEPLQISISPLLPSATSLPKPSASLHSPPSTIDCPTGGRNESNIQQLLPSSSSLSLTPQPLFPPSVVHTFHSAHQPYNSYPAGYNPTRTTWMLPTPLGTPIPSLCSTANSSSSIPSYTQRDWYGHQRTRKERSPHRGSGSRRCSSNAHSKSSKSKSSQSYSCSSSRSGSRSRSRSQSRSRPHSPHSHHRDRHTRSRPPSSYSYGYKRLRSPTPSSSSSPRRSHRSRSKSPSEHRRNHRHRSKGSSSHSCTSRKGERSKREAVTVESNLYDQHSKHRGSLELKLDSERFLQWKKDYTMMCEKYFSAYVSQFHVPPLPPVLTVASNHYPGWDDMMKTRYSYASDSHKPHMSRREKHSPSSESSSYTHSQSSSDSGSTGSQSPCGSHSSNSHVANDRSSPTSQSSSKGPATPSEDGPKMCSPLPLTQIKENKAGQGDKITENKKQSLENVKNNLNKLNKWEEDGGEDNRKNEKQREKTNPSICERDSSAQDKTPVCDDDVSESVQMLPKPHSPTRKDLQGKIKKKRKLEEKKEKRKISETHSKEDLERQRKERTSEEAASVNTTRKQSPVDARALDSGSQKKRKKEEENILVNKSEGHFSFDPEIQMRESSVRDEKTLKSERKRQAVTETNIWEGGITVKPQKKISISINLDLKGKGENIDQKDESCLDEITEKSEDTKEHTAVLAEDKSQMETVENDKSESKSQIVLQENMKQAQEGEKKQWNKNIFTNSNFVMLREDAAEDGDGKDEQESNWRDALSGDEEEVAGNEEALTARDDHQEENMEELATSALKPSNENTSVEHKGETQEAELEEKTMKWNEGDDKIHDGQDSTTTGSEPVVGGGEAEESPEIQASVKTKRENPSGQLTDSLNMLEIMKISSSKWDDCETKDIGEVKNTSSTILPQLSVGKIKLEIKKHKNPLRLRTTKWDQDTGSVLEKDRDKKKNSTSSSSQPTVSPSNGKDRNSSSSYVPKHREPSTERDRSRGRETERTKYNESSRVRMREKNMEKEGERSYTTSGQNRNQSNPPKSCTDMEGRNWQNEGQRWSSNSSSCPDGNPPGPRSRGSSTSSRYSDWPDHRAHKSHQVIKESVSPDWKHKEKHNSHSDFQDQSKIYRHQERPAGIQHHSPPIRSHSHSQEKRSSETSGDGFNQRPTQRKSLNESKQERNKWELVIGDNPVKEGKSRRENPECRMGEKKERKEKKQR
uniref:RING-type domain-containing protein n=3 Tax=Gouania willdenowi TaxID=441366 RepID=A0A8C5H073_GOUWI